MTKRPDQSIQYFIARKNFQNQETRRKKPNKIPRHIKMIVRLVTTKMRDCFSVRTEIKMSIRYLFKHVYLAENVCIFEMMMMMMSMMESKLL